METLVKKAGTFSDEEVAYCKSYVRERIPENAEISELRLSRLPNGDMDVDYVLAEPKFERIRRITG